MRLATSMGVIVLLCATAPVDAEVAPDAVDDFVQRHTLSSADAVLPSTPALSTNGAQVRMIYLVPSDKVDREDYALGMQRAILDLRSFYQSQMGIISGVPTIAGVGTGFTTHDPVVEVHGLPHESSYYNSFNQNGAFAFWFTVLADAFDATGGGFDDPSNRWVYYIDADPACGQGVGATSGVALLPANDLRGLVGEPNVPPCPGSQPDTAGYCRWVGGLGHELGHALGLPHPPGCDQGTCSEYAYRSLMYVGYTLYPDTYLLEADTSTLRQSAFFSLEKTAWPTINCRGELVL
jgi:hypothetical protein